MTESLQSRFLAWCSRARLPRHLRVAADVVRGFLAFADAGEEPNPDLKRAAKAAADQIEAWKASR